MADTVVEIEGVDTLVRTLGDAADDIESLEDGHKAVADLIAGEARARAPRRTGRLAGSLRGTVTAGKATASSDLVYAPPIHWGWRARNIKPNRFLTEAAEDTEPEWLALYEKDIQEALDGVKGA